MWLFLASDSMTFGGLLVSHLIFRFQNTDWPHPADHLALSLGMIMTILLLGSSITMMKAITAAQRSRTQQFQFFMSLTISAGALFLTLQAYEWRHLFQRGLTISSNPWGAPLFGATFYSLTGFHGLHVLVGVIYLSSLLLLSMKQSELSAHYERTDMAGLYWHFVDVVWVIVFTCLYVL
jgi:heme/copper-type cytochrome/quinol oxidase subunit 3